MLPFEPLKPFQHISGSNCGTWSDFDSAWTALEFLGAVNESYELHLNLTDNWRELASDLGHNDDLGLECYADLINDKLTDYLPPYCYAVWDDSELTLQPSVESAADCEETFAEIPYNEEKDRDLNPDNLEFIVVVNDHGNTSLYRWQRSDSIKSSWVEVWAVV